MIKGPLNPKYIRAEVRIGHLTMNTARTDQVVGIEDSTWVVGLDNTIEIIVLEETLEDMEDKIVEEDTEVIGIMIMTEAETGWEKGHLQEIIAVTETEAWVTVDLGSRVNTNRGRIRCYNGREYDHFARDCPNSREERELERLQQMLDMEEEEQTYRQNSPIENHRSPLNLWMVGMTPPHSYH